MVEYLDADAVEEYLYGDEVMGVRDEVLVRYPADVLPGGGSGGGGGAGVDVVLIAAAYSTDESKAAADFVCDGVDDQAEFYDALALGVEGRALQIILAPGIYRFSRPVDLERTEAEYIGFSTPYNSDGDQWEPFSESSVQFRMTTPGYPLFTGMDPYQIRFDGIDFVTARSQGHLNDYQPTHETLIYGSNEYVQATSTSFDLSIADADIDTTFTTELDLRVEVRVGTWASTSSRALVSKWLQTGDERQFALTVQSGALWFFVSDDGAANTVAIANETVSTDFDGQRLWLRVTYSGADEEVRFFYSLDQQTTWVELGTPQPVTGFAELHDSTAPLEIGSLNGGQYPFSIELFGVEVWSQIGGYDASPDAQGVLFRPTTPDDVDTSATAEFTVDRPNQRVYLDGTGYLSTTTSYFPTRLGVAAKIAADEWDSGSTQTIMSNWDTSTNKRSWMFQLNGTGNLTVSLSGDGTVIDDNALASTEAVPYGDGEAGWVACAWRNIDKEGLLGNNVYFYTSSDGETWTQLGDPVPTTVDLRPAYFSNTAFEIGGHSGGTDLFTGYVYKVALTNSSEAPDGDFAENVYPGLPDFPNAISTAFHAGYAEANDSTTIVTRQISGNESWTLNGGVTVSTIDTWTIGSSGRYLELRPMYGPGIILNGCSLATVSGKGRSRGIVCSGAFSMTNSWAQSEWGPVIDCTGDYFVGTIRNCAIYNSGIDSTIPAINFDTGYTDYDYSIILVSITDCMSDGNAGPLFHFGNSVGVRVADNTFLYDSYANFPIILVDNNAQQVIINNNVLEGHITLDGVRRCSVQSNEFRHPGLAAVTADSCEQLTITGNTIISPSTYDTGYAAILLTDTDETVVHGNAIHAKEDADPGSLIRLEGTSSDNTITHNKVTSDYAVDAIELVAGATPQCERNVVDGNDVGTLGITDGGVDTLLNRTATEAAGSSNPPAGTYPPGTTVENTDDNTVWMLVNDTWVQIG